ncbi:MAG TPA: hypothetical protein VNC22_22550 [Sporichthya sp.]|jgi:hypothetical protein|nr:hypothetical protein [Sporichthya sp.]
MDMTSHAAAIAVELGATLGLVGLIGVPFLALRQARRDAILAERAWVEIRAARRAEAAAAAEITASAEVETPAGAGNVIGSQRRAATLTAH